MDLFRLNQMMFRMRSHSRRVDMTDLKRVYQLITDIWKLMKDTINRTSSEETWKVILSEAGRISNTYSDLKPLPDKLLVGYINYLEEKWSTQNPKSCDE